MNKKIDKKNKKEVSKKNEPVLTEAPLKKKKKLKRNYFSLICKTPIKVKRLKAITGAQTDKIKGILSVLPNAKERSLK